MSYSGRVAVVRRFGPPENISLETLPSPALTAGQVRVAVRDAGINPVDTRLRAGTFGGSTPMALGTEYAGTIIESQDDRWPVGTDVLGWGVQGADADLVVTDGTRLVTKPAAVDWPTAAGIGGVGSTAQTALDSLRLAAGDLVVVHGAAGGVGTVLVQLAVARGLHVIGTAGESNQEHVRDLGATPVLYGPGLADRIATAAGERTVAASIDLAGTAEAGDVATAVVAAGGQAITLVPETTQSHGIPLVRSRRTEQSMTELLELLVDGRLRFPVETMPLTDIVGAHRRLDAKHARGKFVLDVSDNPWLTAGTGSEA